MTKFGQSDIIGYLPLGKCIYIYCPISWHFDLWRNVLCSLFFQFSVMKMHITLNWDHICLHPSKILILNRGYGLHLCVLSYESWLLERKVLSLRIWLKKHKIFIGTMHDVKKCNFHKCEKTTNILIKINVKQRLEGILLNTGWTYHRVCNKNNTTGDISLARIGCSSGVHEFTSDFSGVRVA